LSGEVDPTGRRDDALAKMSTLSASATPDRTPITRLKLALLLVMVATLTLLLLARASFLLVLSQLMIEGPLLLAWLGAGFGIGDGLMSLARRVARGEPGRGANHATATTYGRSVSISPVLRVITHTAIGLGVLSLLILALGSLGVLSQVASILVLLGANAWTITSIYRRREDARTYISGAAGRSQLILAIAMPIVAATVLGALVVPWILWGDEPHAYDVVAYHFQLPREWLEGGRISATPHNVFGYFPLNVEMHYLFAMTLRGGATAGMFLAQLMHAAMMVLTLGAVYGAVRTSVGARLASTESSRSREVGAPADRGSGKPDALQEVDSNGSRLNASVAVVFAAAFPWMLMLGSVGYNECGVLLFTTLSLAWTLRKHWLLAGVCAGFAAGCKITSLPTLVLLLPVMALLEAATRRRFEWRGVALLLLGSILTLSPWLVRTAILAGGNPVFPIAARTFGSAHFDPGMVERFEVAHEARPDQQSLAGRVAALNEQVLGEYKFGSARVAGVEVPLLLLVTFAATALRLRERQAWVLASFIVGNVIIWLFSTHLQGRFLVPIIPAAALLVGGVALHVWPTLVLAVSLASIPFSFSSVYQRLAAPAALSGIAYPEPWVFLPEPLVKLITSTNRPVYLIGDARAFLYPLSTEQLHYRSVFDVSSIKPFREAWLGDAPASDAIVVVVPSELARFENTYRNLPKMPDDWRGRPMFVTDVEFKSFVPVE
jgi:hypothetical protein